MPTWVSCKNGEVPPHAVMAGHDNNGEALYVVRAFHEGDTIPGKLVTSDGCAYVAWGGGEHRKHHYEVLTASRVSWVTCHDGRLPYNAFPAGNTAQGESLFVGRFQHENSMTPGKVHSSHGSCYIPYGGREIASSYYEVLSAQ